MTASDFIDYIETLLHCKESFYKKSLDDQLARNQRRAPSKRWNETKMERVIDKQWRELLTNIYNKIKILLKSNASKQAWIDFILTDDFIDSIDESVFEIEFE